ncbi:hypothetical protein ACFQ0B_81280 [Nonomuraea thailandensis]
MRSPLVTWAGHSSDMAGCPHSVLSASRVMNRWALRVTTGRISRAG